MFELDRAGMYHGPSLVRQTTGQNLIEEEMPDGFLWSL